MSGSQDPSRLPSLPGRRQPRRLGKLAFFLSLGVLVAIVGAFGWVFFGIIAAQEQQSAGSAPPSDVASARPSDDLLTGDDPSLLNTSMPVSAPVGAPVESPQAAPAQSGNRQLTVHEQARLQAWSSYYQQLAEQQQQRHRGKLEAMSAPMVSEAQQVGGSGAAAAPGVPGASPGTGATARPGTMDQGPANAANLYLATAPVPPISAYEIKSTVQPIQFTVDQDVESGAPGQFSATVKATVTDYATGNHTLIPAGARLVILYEDSTNPNDERMKAAVTKIIYPPTHNPYCPGGEELPIGSMPAGDSTGKAGMLDQVSRHTGRRLYNALIRAIGGTGPAIAGSFGNGAMQQATSQMSMQGGLALSGGLNDPGPTFTVRKGFSGTLQLTKTIAFDQPWQPGMGFCGNTPSVSLL